MLAILLIAATCYSWFTPLANVYSQTETTELSNHQNPTKLAIIYQEPRDAGTGTELSAEQIAKKFKGPIIYDRKRMLRHRQVYVDAGVDNNQFIIYTNLSSFPAPKGFQDVTRMNKHCTAEERTFKPLADNRITLEQGDFCDIQASRLDQKPFDHDLSETDNNENTNSSRVIATKDWFLRDANGNFVQPSDSKYEYADLMPNPGNKHMREYFIARIRREFKGGKTKDGKTTWKISGAKKIFLDNIDLSLKRAYRYTNEVRQYTSHDVYATAVLNWVKEIDNRLGTTAAIWANLTVPGVNPHNWWQEYSTVLDGAMSESGSTGYWGYRYRTPEELAPELRILDLWKAAGKELVLSDWLPGASSKDLRYGWVTYLAITRGKDKFSYNAVTREGGYKTFYNSPDYYLKLGTPGNRTIVRNASGHPIKISREFQCGRVVSDIINKVGTVTTFACK